jgi:Ca-activated chloride channel family protein
MSVQHWLSRSRARYGLAAALVILSFGALVLMKVPASGASVLTAESFGPGGSRFSGPGASGTFSLSQVELYTHGEQRFFAELQLRADELDGVRERAPLALAIVLDTSGSMGGAKIRQAKDAASRLINGMRDDDQVVFVSYSGLPTTMQPLAPVGDVRESLESRISSLSAGGGTNIPPALDAAYRELQDASPGRVRRVVLVSDGLDDSQVESEALALRQLDRQVTTSALGIGLDFDESYMAAVASTGRGNYGFVRDASALTQFLERELEETAQTTIHSATARLRLPRGVRFVQALGAEPRERRDGEIELRLGSLFGGDERRIVVELAAQPEVGEKLKLDADVSWRQLDGDRTRVEIGALTVTGTDSRRAAEASRNGQVYASCVSALASQRQLAAARAYREGDQAKADSLIQENIIALDEARVAAPAAEAAELEQQKARYGAARSSFARAKPRSAAGKAAAKAATERDLQNFDRKAW